MVGIEGLRTIANPLICFSVKCSNFQMFSPVSVYQNIVADRLSLKSANFRLVLCQNFAIFRRQNVQIVVIWRLIVAIYTIFWPLTVCLTVSVSGWRRCCTNGNDAPCSINSSQYLWSTQTKHCGGWRLWFCWKSSSYCWPLLVACLNTIGAGDLHVAFQPLSSPQAVCQAALTTSPWSRSKFLKQFPGISQELGSIKHDHYCSPQLMLSNLLNTDSTHGRSYQMIFSV